MVTIAIGLAIIVSLVGILVSNSSSSRTNDLSSELSNTGRYALASMKEELRQAGFRGYTWALPGTPGPWTAPTSGCADTGSTAGSFLSNIGQGVWGADNANPFSGNCIPAASYAANTDVLVIRRLGSAPVCRPVCSAQNGSQQARQSAHIQDFNFNLRLTAIC